MKLSDFEKATIEAFEDCTGAVRNCGINAIYHLKKAYKIREIDEEMSVFRGMTAEEEAVASLFYCLKNRQYENSSSLSFKSHVHKQAFYPFLQSVSIFLEKTSKIKEFPFEEFKLSHTEFEGRRAIKLSLKIKGHDGYIEPVPPLHFTIFDNKNGTIIFKTEFQKIVEDHAFKDVKKYVQHVANQRNILLYANNSGVPALKGDIVKYLAEQKKKVFLLLNIVLMIDPWTNEGRSLFVQQVLDAFLIILERLDRSEMTIKTKVTGNA